MGRTRGAMWGCGDEEGLALEHGGRVIIFSQEFPHLKSSLGAPSLYVCSRLLHHVAAAPGPWLRGAISSASGCVCVCVSITPDYSWFINYNSLSSIQFLSLATQNTGSALLPRFFAIYFGLISSSSSPSRSTDEQKLDLHPKSPPPKNPQNERL